MGPVSDQELLERYARDDDHAAFADLVRRYIGLVYATARRQTRGDPHLADDVTQAVMIVLARRGGSIARGTVLSSWLFTVTRHCAQNALKIQTRRQIHEHRAAVLCAEEARRVQSSTQQSHDAANLSDALHEAIARLREPERAGVVLHFFQNRTHREVGDALGLSAGAARKRIERGVEKMRLLLSGRGVVVTSAAIVATIRADAATGDAVPSHLASSAFNVAILAGSGQAAPNVGSLVIAHAVGRMFAVAKLKAVAAILLVGAVAVPLLGAGAYALATKGASAAPPATAPADGPFTARVTDQITVRFLGVAPHPADETQWRDITGEPIDIPDPRLTDNTVNTDSGPDTQIAMLVTHPPDTEWGLRIDGCRTNSNTVSKDGSGATLMRARFAMLAAADTMSLRLAFATRPWQTIAECDVTDQPAELDAGKYGPITIMPPHHEPRWGKGSVTVEHEPVHSAAAQMFAVDDAGNRHLQKLTNQDNNDAGRAVTTFVFDVPHDKIKKVIIQVREFDKYLVARDISISPDVKSNPKIEVVDAREKKDEEGKR